VSASLPTTKPSTAPAGMMWVFNEDLNDGNGGWDLVKNPAYVPLTESPTFEPKFTGATGSSASAPTRAPRAGTHWEEAPMLNGISQGWLEVPDGKSFADTQVKGGYSSPASPRVTGTPPRVIPPVREAPKAEGPMPSTWMPSSMQGSRYKRKGKGLGI
jgi:hypothetical protein